MLKINKENTETIYDINLSEKMKKKIIEHWTSSEGETLDYVKSLGVVMTEDIKQMIIFLEDEGNEEYYEKNIVPELKEIVAFCKKNDINYISIKLLQTITIDEGHSVNPKVYDEILKNKEKEKK